MSLINIRASQPSDADAVLRLLRLIADLHRTSRPDMFPHLESKYDLETLRDRFSKGCSGVFIAESDGAVVGYIFTDIIKEGDGTTLYIDDLCVDPDFRRMGVATKLMHHAKEYAKTSGCAFLMLNVWEFNKEAFDFYTDFGFTTRTRHLELKI